MKEEGLKMVGKRVRGEELKVLMMVLGDVDYEN